MQLIMQQVSTPTPEGSIWIAENSSNIVAPVPVLTNMGMLPFTHESGSTGTPSQGISYV